MKQLYTSLRNVFMKPRTPIITIGVAGIFLVFIALLPNRELILSLPDSYSLWERFRLATSLLGTLRTNFTTLTLASYVFIALLTGINVALAYEQMKSRTRLYKASGASALGVFLGVVGVGCAACGSVILSSIIGLTAASQIIGFFPLKGVEFTIMSTLLLLWSTCYLLKKVRQPDICKRS